MKSHYWLTRHYKKELLKEIFFHLKRFKRKGISIIKIYLTNKFYNGHLSKFETIYELLGDKEIKTILDIGSYDGSDAIVLSRIFPDAQIYCFEADKNNFEKLVRNVAYCKRITPINIAISNKEEIVEFYPSDGKNNEEDFKGSGSILQPLNKHSENWENLIFKESVKINAISIAEWACRNKINQIDFVWMDVQGAELKVLEGFNDLLSTVKSFILEIWDNKDYYQNSANFEELSGYFLQNHFRMSNLWKTYFTGDALFINGKFF